MQRDVNKNVSSHPSSRELADFVDGKLNKDRRAEITKHLIACDECSDVMALVMKYGKKKPKVINNIYYKGLGVALVASVVLFIVMPKENTNPPFIDFYTNATQTSFNSAVEASEIKDIKKSNQEINNFLIKIIKSTDMSYLKEFNLAEEKLKQKELDNARELYQMAMNMVEDMPNLDKREKDKQNIVISYKILLLSKAEDDNESFSEYRDKLRDDVRRFKKRWIEPHN